MRHIGDLDVSEKSVFLRVDFNVPLDEKGEIRDDTRIRASLPTIRYLLDGKAKLIISSHLGRPKGQINPKLSLKPVAVRLCELLAQDVILAPDSIDDEVEKLKNVLRDGQVMLLENIRFHAEETANDPAFAQKLAQGVDCYVNDAFGASHRAHASVVGIARYVKEKAAGLLLQKEVEYLSKAIRNPQKPYVVILGGAKVSDKIPIIENLLRKADDILVGGAMAYTFFKAQGKDVGKSLVEDDKLEMALKILDKAKEMRVKFSLPQDHILASSLEAEAEMETAEAFPFPAGWMAVDIGPKTIGLYSETISRAKTVFWNGPLGVFEIERFARGTMGIAESVANSQAITIVGGGDSIAAVYKAGVADRITHISTGGGASLEYLANETLPGIEALE